MQEVRLADDNVVVPMDVKLPSDKEPERFAAYMLGLTFPFRTCCSQEERAKTEVCFECHSMVVNNEEGWVAARFRSAWKHWRACMLVRSQHAEARLLRNLSLPVLKDVVGCREWFSGPSDSIESPGPSDSIESRGMTFFCQWLLRQIFASWNLPTSTRHGIDFPRIFETLAHYLGIQCSFHVGQLTPFEHLAYVQTLWLDRFLLHHEARQTSSARRRAERFKYMMDVDEAELEKAVRDMKILSNNWKFVLFLTPHNFSFLPFSVAFVRYFVSTWWQDDDAGPMEVEGEEVDDDMEGADDIERMLRAEHPVLLTELTEVLFREADWLKAIAPRGRASKQKEMLDILKKLVEALGGLPLVSRRFVASPPAAEVSQTKSPVEMSRLFQQQRAALVAQTGSVSGWVG